MRFEDYKDYIEVLSYDDAKKKAIDYFIDNFKLNNNSLPYGFFLDNPYYPANEDLFYEFYDELGFMYEAFNDYIIRIINNHSDETGIHIYKSFDENGNENLRLIEQRR